MSIIVAGYDGVNVDLLYKEGLRIISKGSTQAETFSRLAKALLLADPDTQVLLSNDPVMSAMAVMIWTHIQKQADFLVWNGHCYDRFTVDRSNVVRVIEATKDYLEHLKEPS